MLPLSFSTEELDLLYELARPIAQSRRPEFLQAVAAEIEVNGHTNGAGVGPGVVH
jgi:hypothetical protein